VAILVTGATGLAGRLLVEELVGQGADVRAGTRRPEAAELPAGVTVADGFEGIDAVFLHPRAVRDFDGFLAEARWHGVRKVVALSAMNVDAPRSFVTALMDRYARHQDKPQHPANGVVAAVLGRPAHTYAEWVAANAAAFRFRGEGE
jgi:uncharacterized protein YbjT (DUF2867 family)